MKKRARRTRPQLKAYYRRLAQEMVWLLFSLFAVLSYLSDIRSYVTNNFGLYPAGVLDGVVVIMALFAVSLYAISLRR